MLELAGKQTPESVRADYEATYAEMRAAGYTAVGEFHYLGEPEARAAVEAARGAGVEIVLLLAAYARGGLERFRQPSVVDYLRQVEALRSDGVAVAVAPHSVRACPPDWLEEIRELEGIVRRQVGRRNVLSTERLLCYGADEGAGALGLERWAEVTVDLEHRSLRGLEDADVFSALVFGCSAEVLSPRSE